MKLKLNDQEHLDLRNAIKDAISYVMEAVVRTHQPEAKKEMFKKVDRYDSLLAKVQKR